MSLERWDDGVVCCNYAWDEHEFEAARHGHAIDVTYVLNGKMWADNLEYCTEINYCPFCGTAKEELINE